MIIAHGLVCLGEVDDQPDVHANTHMHKSVCALTKHRDLQVCVYTVMHLQEIHVHAHTTSPRHPNRHSVRWIYCKQSPQEDDHTAGGFGFSLAQ